ncbi:MAG: UvrD-helicase domain-containing protein [Bacteroidales bacterium]|nr:UvrD-helicase domain-containing protein [Bacteroidales bacterium]
MASAKRKLITDSPLVIYKASAGSGKTFTLTLYYLWLLFSKSRFEESLPSEKNKSYRHILAVTFTNKATGEMKARIIKSLYNLASGVEDGNSKIYADELIATGCVKDYQELQERAREILYTLLHDYTNFNVSTIDTFFQKTMRAFVRDIGVQGGYNVELDSESMAKEAIDRMYLSLSDDGDNTTLRKWL